MNISQHKFYTRLTSRHQRETVDGAGRLDTSISSPSEGVDRAAIPRVTTPDAAPARPPGSPAHCSAAAVGLQSRHTCKECTPARCTLHHSLVNTAANSKTT
ncbi:hypothetical protein EVAR_28543_1 [Eumeta japonica]|uniref:Uncharacterized protein n=1 Tax=Eumeta variegata TaxID=151549 RepID=A0A4C1UYP0_EUMVA|nr:hypothetical protein EVAR_28543_1 [Eumeta japonica]